MPHLVAAPDKFRGTATASGAAAAIVAGATSAGWSASAAPMSDGGEGFLDALGGELRTTLVRGPLGEQTLARWSLLDDGTAIVEAAEAVGRALLAFPRGDEPLKASTFGVGELIAAAQRSGARSIVVGVGGTATTDGGRGCIEALDAMNCALQVPLIAACDVLVRFDEAPSRFAPQKGAGPEQVELLERRLDQVADWFRDRFEVDVDTVAGAGAGGGLAGGLIALGATVVSGATYVAAATGLGAALAAADLVVTGEGALDAGTLEGKVVATVLRIRPTLAALVLAGRVDDGAGRALAETRAGPVEVAVLNEGIEDTLSAIALAVTSHLGQWRPVSAPRRSHGGC